MQSASRAATTEGSEAAPKEGADRAHQVQRIFSEIAPRYDLLNHVLSLNIDKRWRKAA
ncbi:MAG: class I SAM-dependent methyltransferase, partial [Gemmatimonadota bacterium]|nr:class I SAM-dependent methyltransferase [Gemmatimonadota bacterium]